MDPAPARRRRVEGRTRRSTRGERGALRALILVAAAGTLAVAGLALSAGPLYAFGPATHIFLGERLLGSLHLLPAHIATLLAAHPRSFLYGSIAADISLAKKYAPVGRHCHFWHVGREIVEEAATDALKAVGLGYVSHLAADTVAHNFFVPRQLLLTSSTKALGHTYWESRLDAQLGEPYSARAREVVIEYDHSAADALFDQVLSATIFSFQTNRRIFRGMIRAQDNDRWRAVFDQVLKRSRWKLTDEEMESYLAPAFDSVVDNLLRGADSRAADLDPVGHFNLQLAKKIRRIALREPKGPGPERLRELADDFFPLPRESLGYWQATEAA
ncbi:MAG: zinc dependent phospholipase C family protein [Gemmatimonadota bacterium]